MTPEKRKAIAWLQDEIRSLRLAPTINGCGMKSEWAEQYDIMQTCLEAVKVCSVDTNKTSPLTLEQLRELNGQPVWIMEAPDWGHWELSEDAGDYLTDRDPELYGLTYPDPEGKGGLHKLGWIAYAYKPAHIECLSSIENILGDSYDLDRLRELVEADRKREFRRQLKRFDIMPTKKTHEKESRIELTDVKTCNLVEELKKREGVDVHVVENRSDMFVMAEGPAVVLVITD